LTFNNPVTGGTASIAPGDHNPAGGGGSVSSVSFSGNDMAVNLAGVTNAQVLTLMASNITDGTTILSSVGVNVGFLIGDVNSTRRTDAGDVTAVRNHTVSIPSDDQTARFDVNTSGRVDAGDVTVTRNASVTGLP
jgi:GTPase